MRAFARDLPRGLVEARALKQPVPKRERVVDEYAHHARMSRSHVIEDARGVREERGPLGVATNRTEAEHGLSRRAWHELGSPETERSRAKEPRRARLVCL